MKTVEERFWEKVEKRPDGCWEWTAAKMPTGYGQLHARGEHWYAHRFSYAEIHGREIPAGLVIDHLCRNRACVNPDHMEPVTDAENLRRGMGQSAINARKTHCLRGHPFDESNTVRINNGKWRMCRICSREMQRLRRARA